MTARAVLSIVTQIKNWIGPAGKSLYAKLPDGVVERIKWMNIESLLGGRAGTVVAAGSKEAARKLLKSGQSLTKKEMDDILNKLPDARRSVAKAGETPQQAGERLARVDRARRKQEDIDTAKADTRGESPREVAAAEKAARPTTTRTGRTDPETGAPIYKRRADSNINPSADVIKAPVSAAARAAARKQNLAKIARKVAAGTAVAGAIVTGAELTKKDKPPEMPAGWEKLSPRTTPPPSAEKKPDPDPDPKPKTPTKPEIKSPPDPNPNPKPKEKDRLTNKEIAKQYDALAFLRRDETQRSGVQTVVWNGNIYGGGMKSVGDSKKLLEDINKYNKGKERPEDPVKRVVKKVAKKVAKKFSEISNRMGGGRVSSRPAKVMKQYVKGGSVRKPKRI